MRALVMTSLSCYGALEIVCVLLFLLLSIMYNSFYKLVGLKSAFSVKYLEKINNMIHFYALLCIISSECPKLYAVQSSLNDFWRIFLLLIVRKAARTAVLRWVGRNGGAIFAVSGTQFIEFCNHVRE